jgi:hypothetical protein
MITTRVGVPFTLRGIQYILPPAAELWQPCRKCVFFNRKKRKSLEDYCILNTKYQHYIIKACSGHAAVYQKFKESKNE